MRPGTVLATPDVEHVLPRPAPPRHRWLLAAGAVAAVQMIVVVTVDGALRPGFDVNRNWVSQLSLGPQGWIGVLNLSVCCGWLLAYAMGLRLFLAPSPTAWWTVRLVLICAAGFAVIAAIRIDPGLGYPPGVPAVHTTFGFVHQAGALVVFASGTVGSVLLGRCVGAARAGLVVAAVMIVAFILASVLVTLDVTGVVLGTPSGLLERVALYLGLFWIGICGMGVLRSVTR